MDNVEKNDIDALSLNNNEELLKETCVNSENGEQPNLVSATDTEVPQDESAHEQDGSLGKFKSKEALYDAYLNLQKEFTKKCQKLSKLEKESTTQEKNAIEEENIKENKTENKMDVLNDLNQEKKVLSSLDNDTISNAEDLKIYQKSDWNKRLAEFLESHEDAKEYAKQISSLLLENEELALKDSALEEAWLQVAAEHFVRPDKIVQDKQFLDKYVLSNDEIKKQILDIYIKELKEQKIPTHITKSYGNSTPVSSFTGPKTLSEAKELAAKLFF